VSLFSFFFIGLQFIVLPLLSFQTRVIIENHEVIPPKRLLYLQSIIMLSIIGGLAALVDWREALAVRIIGPIELRFMLFGAALYAFGVLINFLHFKFFQNDSKAEDEIILPEKQNDYFLWVLLCLVAALSEEFVYRGVLTHLLAKHGMLFILAAMMSAVSFSFSHYTQGWLAIPITFLFALGFQYLYHLSGSILLPIIVHFFYNITIELLRRSLIGPVTSSDRSPD